MRGTRASDSGIFPKILRGRQKNNKDVQIERQTSRQTSRQTEAQQGNTKSKDRQIEQLTTIAPLAVKKCCEVRLPSFARAMVEPLSPLHVVSWSASGPTPPLGVHAHHELQLGAPQRALAVHVGDGIKGPLRRMDRGLPDTSVGVQRYRERPILRDALLEDPGIDHVHDWLPENWKG